MGLLHYYGTSQDTDNNPWLGNLREPNAALQLSLSGLWASPQAHIPLAPAPVLDTMVDPILILFNNVEESNGRDLYSFQSSHLSASLPLFTSVN